MEAEGPEAWRVWGSAAELQEDNVAALVACRELAVKNKKGSSGLSVGENRVLIKRRGLFS